MSVRTVSLAALSIAASTILLFSCSMNRLATRAVANVLSSPSGAAGVFAGDDDPELVADALPFALKTYEAVLAADPGNAELSLSTGRTFIMYANAFVQGPASMLPPERIADKTAAYARAKKLYLRGRNYVVGGLEARHPGFRNALSRGDVGSFLPKMGKDDVAYLYWAAAGWVGAFSLDPTDFSVMQGVPASAALMSRAFALEPDFSDGAIPEFYISFYAGMPSSLGGDKSKVDAMFSRAVEASKGFSASPYVSYAVAVCIPAQDPAKFRELMAKALAIDPDARPGLRLANLLAQRKARWYLAHIDSFFIDSGEEEN